VNFDNVFCSAKLDTCHGDGEWPADAINLLFNGAGERAHTAVAAVACSAGPGETTHLHMTAFQVVCGADTYALSFDGITQEGNVTIPHTNGVSPGLLGGIYFGTESLPGQGKVFTNVAFVLPTTTVDGAEVGVPCSVDWFVVPSTSAVPPQAADGQSGTFTQVAGVSFVSTPASVTYGTCDQHPLNGDFSVVRTGYHEGGVIDFAGTLAIETTSFGGAQGAGGDDVGVSVCVPEEDGVTMAFLNGPTYHLNWTGEVFADQTDYITLNDGVWGQSEFLWLTIGYEEGAAAWVLRGNSGAELTTNTSLLGTWTFGANQFEVTCGQSPSRMCISLTLGGAAGTGTFRSTAVEVVATPPIVTLYGAFAPLPEPADFVPISFRYQTEEPFPEADGVPGWRVVVNHIVQYFPTDEEVLPESFVLEDGEGTYTVVLTEDPCP